MLLGIKALFKGLSQNRLNHKQVCVDTNTMPIGPVEEIGFVDSDAYIERIVFAYIDRIPVKRYYDRSMNMNNFINILCTIYKIKPSPQNIRAFIDASMDNNIERRKQISSDFWQNATYSMVDVQKAISVYKDHPFAGFHIYSHQLRHLNHDVINDIMLIIEFFRFDKNDAVFNCVIKTLSDYPEDHVDVSITNYKGVWVVIKNYAALEANT